MRYVDLKILTIQIENVQSLRRKIIFDFILTNEDKVNYNFKLLFLYNNSVSTSKIEKHQQYFFQIDMQSYSHSNIKITNDAKMYNGGYRHGSGRGKKGWYKGIYCDSSWELAFVVYHLDNNIPIERCSDKRTYVFENQTKNYYPDFVVNSQIFEIKGYETLQSKAKQLFNPDIILIDKEGIKPYLEYTINKYTKNFLTLYEKN